jgi:hypothetical protein
MYVPWKRTFLYYVEHEFVTLIKNEMYIVT